MNFKIENNYINLNNYPFLEKHFEDMASRGWLIKKIIGGSLFIYRKIKPEELDFSISPFEVETFFNKKTKAELDEFHSVCEYVGWNFASSSGDFHIYYKEKGSEASPLETDDEETFKTLEKLAKNEEINQYLLSVMIIILSWFLIKDLFRLMTPLKDGLYQIIIISFPIILMMPIYRIIHINRFLKINRERIELGRPIYFKESNFIFYRILMTLFNILLFIGIAYLILASLFVDNYWKKLIYFIPSLLGMSFGFIFRRFIKPLRKNSEAKALILIVFIIISISLSTYLLIDYMDSFEIKSSIKNIGNYKILRINHLSRDEEEEDFSFTSNSSLLIPISYESSSYGANDFIRSHYSSCLNESIAKYLVERYIRQAEKNIAHQIEYGLSNFLSNGYFERGLEVYGLTRDDFENFKDMDISRAEEEIRQLAIDRSIGSFHQESWGIDEAYYLNFEKTTILLRDSKEVFYLDNQMYYYHKGLDLSQPDHIRIIKDQLKLK